MANYLDLHELSTFEPEGSAHDKHLKAWIENMQKTASLEFFPNSTTASNVNEGTRILLRERAQKGTPLRFAAVWDTVRNGYLMSCGAGSENVGPALQLLNGGSKPARVLMAQVRQPFSSRNGQEARGSKNVEDMNVNMNVEDMNASPEVLREQKHHPTDAEDCGAVQETAPEQLDRKARDD